MLGEPVPANPDPLDTWIAERHLTAFEESWRGYPEPCLEALKQLPHGPRLLTGIWLDRGIDFVTGRPSPTADETAVRIEQLTELPGRILRHA